MAFGLKRGPLVRESTTMNHRAWVGPQILIATAVRSHIFTLENPKERSSHLIRPSVTDRYFLKHSRRDKHGLDPKSCFCGCDKRRVRFRCRTLSSIGRALYLCGYLPLCKGPEFDSRRVHVDFWSPLVRVFNKIGYELDTIWITNRGATGIITNGG